MSIHDPQSTFRIFVVAVLIAALASSPASAASPRLENLQPQGGQRGTEVTVSLHGPRIGQEAEQVLFNTPGIEVRGLEPVDDNHVKAQLAIAANSPLGIHPLRVRTASGITNLRTFHVGALPEMDEEEPNNDFAEAQEISLGVVVNGVISSEDVDCFVVEAEEGERISIEVEGLRLGRTFFDPAVTLYDENGTELAFSDDSTLLRQDCFVSIEAPHTGRYFIELRETAYQGSDASSYRMHVGQFPRPAAAFPGGGPPGETLEVRWLGKALGESAETVTLPAERALEHPLFASDDGGISPTGVPLRVVDLPNVLEEEPNNSAREANAGTVPAAFCGVLSEPGDRDFFRFAAKKGEVFDLHAVARAIRSPLDPVLRIREEGGRQLASNDDNAGFPDSYIRFTAPEDGDYVVEISDHLGEGSPLHVYRIEVTRPEPVVDLALEERTRLVATEIAVPQGGHTAAMITATRRDVDGELQVELGDLPEGVVATVFPLAADYNRVPVLFAAEPTAPRDARLATVTATLVDDSQPVRSNFRQQTWLVRGRNDVPVWSHFADRAAVAVVKPAPFSVRIVEPQAPLVQSGSMELHVVAERDEGFTAPIAVKMLYDPPGVSSNQGIRIPEGGSEVSIPITAAGNASAREWNIVVIAEADVNGPLLVSSEFAKLRVATPYLAMTYPSSAATEQGSSIDYTIDVEQLTAFEGEARVELLGLPPGVTAEPQTITVDAAQVEFPLQVADDAKTGLHRQLVCRVVITENGEPVTHTIGSGQLRIEAPLPQQPSEQTAQQASSAPEESS